MTDDGVDEVLAGLTLEQKAGLTSGADFWHTAAAPGVPAVMVSDGPHGLRKQDEVPDHLGIGASVPATCFPTAAALGSTWDPALATRVGAALGAEARANGVSVLLGPGVNIKRTPLGGRNFEYVSEDPHLAGTLASALVQGVQSQGVGTSLKHYAANNQETDRLRVSADVDERTLREIYLPAFEQVVTTARPWTVMCAYNKVNGVYASQDPWLLTRVLRDEWGFDGLVVSDWGAVHDRVAALAAGLDLQMPGIGAAPDEEVVAAVREGRLDEAVLDTAVRRLIDLVAKAGPALAEPGTVDLDAHHALAREVAAAGSVLLKNDPVHGTPLLPLNPDLRVGVVGELARTPRYQGAGSSQVNPTRLDDALTALRSTFGDLPFAPGFRLTGEDDGALREQAVRLARDVDVVLVFLGLPGADESEGYDRSGFGLPPAQVATLQAVVDANPRVVVVLANGSPVATDWSGSVPAVLETWLGGQAGGSATAAVLTGALEPGGRLAETIPHRIEDTPAFGNFPGEAGHVRYGEGILVGYRWYDTRLVDVAYPFGHGLTYTTFGYGPLTATVTGTGAQVQVGVSLDVTNTGSRDGAEVVQLYLGDPGAAVLRPTRELVAFAKVHLTPGQTRTLTFTLGHRDLAYWHPALHRWAVQTGELVLTAGASSRDLRSTATVHVDGDDLTEPLTADSTIAQWLAHPVGGPLLAPLLLDDADGTPAEADPWMAQVPLSWLVGLGRGGVTAQSVCDLVTQVGEA